MRVTVSEVWSKRFYSPQRSCTQWFLFLYYGCFRENNSCIYMFFFLNSILRTKKAYLYETAIWIYATQNFQNAGNKIKFVMLVLSVVLCWRHTGQKCKYHCKFGVPDHLVRARGGAAGRSRVRIPTVLFLVFIDLIFPTPLWPWLRLNLWQKCVPGLFPGGVGVKEAGAYSWQPNHLHVPIVLKSGSLSLLELSGPLQACTKIALPFWSLSYNFTNMSPRHCLALLLTVNSLFLYNRLI